MGGFAAMITIGDHRIVPVLDAVARRDPTKLYPTTTAADWAAFPEHLSSDGELELFLGGYVLETGGRLVLIDAGVGPAGWTAPSGTQLPGGYLLDNLRVAGLGAEDFTDVVCTHLHPDHVGWTSLEGRAVFPNATYRCHSADWRHFVEEDHGDPFTADLLAPIADRFEFWDAAISLFPGVDIVPAPGHTPGSSIVVLSADSGERAVLLGDVVHCPVELLDDEWATMGDVDPVMAKATKDRLARELEGTATQIGAAHFPGLQFGRLLVGEPRRRWAQVGGVPGR
jgi:glyoxylase-like metal-dependent hydrolase (beta-lactamase superfamily II)